MSCSHSEGCRTVRQVDVVQLLNPLEGTAALLDAHGPMLGRCSETAVALQSAMLMSPIILINPGHELVLSPALLLCGCRRCSSATQAAA
jgi:hypothetical protein